MRLSSNVGTQRIRTLSAGPLPPVCLALFVFAGYFKAADPLQFLPIDLTLLFWAITAAFCLLVLWRQRRLPPGAAAMLLVFAGLALGLHWPDDIHSYPAQKELRLFSLTALAAFAPLFLLQEDRALRAFAYTAAAIGVVMAAAAVLDVVVTMALVRVDVFNTNPILLGRACGFTVLLLCLLYWMGKLRLRYFLPLAAAASFGLIASASRGPLFALGAAMAAVVPFCIASADSRTRVVGTVVAGCAGMAAAFFYMDQALLYPARRLLRLFTGEWGTAELSRWSMWQQTWDLIAGTPLGIGWGHLSAHVQIIYQGRMLFYPHDIFLEIAAEAGWAPAVLFTALVALVMVACVREARRAMSGAADRSGSIRTLVALAAVSYWLGCALVSGDVNDNRTLWVMLGMALAAQGDWRSRRIASDGRVGGSLGDEAISS